MKKYSRAINTLKGSIMGMVLLCINTIGGFASRTLLIYVLGVEYAGLNGLFTSILTVLNMAEMGFGSAIVYKLYKPIAEGDTLRVCALMNYYKKVYRYIGIGVFCVGILIIPFLKVFIHSDVPKELNIYILYLIYLGNCCLTYWLFAYKTAIISAHQRTDLSNGVNAIVFTIKYIIQIICLLFFKNYYVYIIVIPITTLMTNIGNAIIANKKFPQYQCDGNISREERGEIKEKILALMFNKFGVAIINGSDNVVISSFLGLAILGIYDSYYYVFSTVHSMFSVFHNAITAGIGNSIITETKEHNIKLFYRLTFINMWAVGWSAICMFCIFEPFMQLWIKEGLVICFALIMSLYFYFWMIRFIVLVFKNAMGLWKEDRFRAAIEGIFNLILNLIMVQIWGIYGVMISTIVAMLFISVPWETKVLFKKYFGISMFSYFCKMAMYFLITLIIGTITFATCNLMNQPGVHTIIYRLCVCIIIPNLLYWIIFRKKEECVESCKYIKYIFGKLKK